MNGAMLVVRHCRTQEDGAGFSEMERGREFIGPNPAALREHLSSLYPDSLHFIPLIFLQEKPLQ